MNVYVNKSINSICAS